MADTPNILFIMADQLRADYLGCNGHPSIKTPTIDALAKESVNFKRAYTQAPVCGPSRMSFYTGRYARTHGATYNNVPLKISEKGIGDYLRPHGYRVGLVGKTHMQRDAEGMERLGVDPASSRGVLVSQCGFEPYERDDGLHPDQSVPADLAYNNYLRKLGYTGHNPWHEYANSGVDESGEVQSGWYMRNAALSARVKDEHSETAYTTSRAIDFIKESKGAPWCLHLSYIKPHWPYIAPAPYHNMYSTKDVIPRNAIDTEKKNSHPVINAFMGHTESISFSRDEVRDRVIPTYMGLITQLDDYIKNLIEFLKDSGEYENTIIVLTSDHGDYLGDHWLGEKELFHEESSRIPLIVHDPRPSADASRGSEDTRLIEAIDLLPTFLDIANIPSSSHTLEGRSLLPILRGDYIADKSWRKYAFSEADYAWRKARLTLELEPDQTRAVMVTSYRWKYVHYDNFPPQLFDLENDPFELHDCGLEEKYESVRQEMRSELYKWFEKGKSRTTVSNGFIAKVTDTAHKRGYLFGYW